MPNPVVVNDNLQQQISHIVTTLLTRDDQKLEGHLTVIFDPTSGETFHVRTVGENFEVTWGVHPHNKERFNLEIRACGEAFKDFFKRRDLARLRREEARRSDFATVQRVLVTMIEDGMVTLNDTLEQVIHKLEVD